MISTAQLSASPHMANFVGNKPIHAAIGIIYASTLLQRKHAIHYSVDSIIVHQP